MDYYYLKYIACEYLNIYNHKEFDKLYKDNWKVALDDWNKYGYEEYDKNTTANIVGLVGFCNGDRTEKLLYPLKGCVGATILDFGGGIGTNSIELLKQGNVVYYYDLESKTQDFAKYLANKLGVNVNFITKEQMESMKFDIILTTDVLEHIKNPMEVVKKLTSLLKPNGFVLTTGLNFSVSPDSPMHLKENLSHKEEYENYMQKNYLIKFYQCGNKESIFLWQKRD